MPTIETPSARLHYEISGKMEAPVLLFSTSLGTTLEMWNPQVEALQPDFRLLRYDMRGHGRSSTPPGPYSIADLGGDVLSLLDALELETVNFCGLSIGGVIGQWLAIHAKPRIEKVVLSNTAAKIGTPEGWDARMADVGKNGMASIAENVVSRWFTEEFRNSGNPLVETMRRMLVGVDAEGYLATCASLRDMDQREMVRSIDTPVCIVAGEYDMVTTVANAEYLHSSIPGSSLKVLPAAHISSAELPAAFNAVLLEFLKMKSST